MTEKLQNNHPVLPGPYGDRPGDTVRPTRPVTHLVKSQVQALLESSPAFRQLPAAERQEIYRNLVKIGAYSAALVQEDFAQSLKLGQTPVLKSETISEPLSRVAAGEGAWPESSPRALQARTLADGPAANEFSPRAANQVARITERTLNAIAFPTFVADLIKGTFQAIVESSIEQMEAYGSLLSNVAKTVDEFMADNITDNMARDYLVASHPGHFQIVATDDVARVQPRPNSDELARPNLEEELNLTEQVDLRDEDAIEQVLVPAARRRLAQSRHQMLSTMVLMGINRIVVTSGRINAKMGFRIDASDTGRVETASQFDFKNETTASYGGGLAGWLSGGPKFRTKNTVAYVSSTKKDSSDELNVEADLTGEVDLKFKSDYFPLDRLATPEMLDRIQGNTPNPAANNPSTGSGGSTTSEPA